MVSKSCDEGFVYSEISILKVNDFIRDDQGVQTSLGS